MRDIPALQAAAAVLAVSPTAVRAPKDAMCATGKLGLAPRTSTLATVRDRRRGV